LWRDFASDLDAGRAQLVQFFFGSVIAGSGCRGRVGQSLQGKDFAPMLSNRIGNLTKLLGASAHSTNSDDRFSAD